MTLPMAPSLSPAAQPYVPAVLPEPPPDQERAWQMFRQSAGEQPGTRERVLRERDLLGCAMANPAALQELGKLEPKEFWHPFNQDVATVLRDHAAEGLPTDAAAVTGELRARGQLPTWADPTFPRAFDPRSHGIGAWETVALAPDSRAPQLAREVRSLHRQDRLIEIAQTALTEYRDGLSFDRTGQLEVDQLGQVTLNLANELVAVPKELYPDRGVDMNASVETWALPASTPVQTQGSLNLPSPPRLSPSALEVLR